MTKADALRKEYEARVNRAIDFVYANCGRDFDLDEMADAACFSRFHFHRIFHAFTGETQREFVKRVRLEKAAGLLRNDPRNDITAVAADCGFSGPSVFARAFKERFGVSASAWRDGKGAQVQGKDGKAAAPDSGYPQGTMLPKEIAMRKIPCTAEVKVLPPLHVAYARHMGPYSGIGEAFSRLYAWAGPRGLAESSSLAIYHDSPELTDASKLRSSACLVVPEGTEVSGDIGLMTVPGGRFAVARFEIAPDEFGAAWDALMGEWMPGSGWQPDDRMCYEVYLNDPEKHPLKRFVIDICEPVKPL